MMIRITKRWAAGGGRNISWAKMWKKT